MVIFAQTRNFVFTVGGLNLTDHLTKFTLSRGQVDFASPKTWTGSFELSPIVGRDNTRLDDFANPATWRRALSLVTLDIPTEGLPELGRVFTGYINLYRWNPNPLQQYGSGTLMDALGLMMLSQRPSEIIKATTELIPIGQLARELVFAGGTDANGIQVFIDITVNNDDAPGFTNAPYTTSDPIKGAQEILGVNQRWLYCDAFGGVKVSRFDWDAGSSFSLSLDDTITFDRDTTIQDYAFEKVIVSGTKEVAVLVIPGIAGQPEPIIPNPDLGAVLGAKDRPLRIITIESKTIGEITGNFSPTAAVNGGNETAVNVISKKIIEYNYNDNGDVIETLTTLEQPLGIFTGTFQFGGKNGFLEPLFFLVQESIYESLTNRTVTKMLGALTGSFDITDPINGGFEVTTPIISAEEIQNFTQAELERIRGTQKEEISNLKFVNSDGNEQNLFQKEGLPSPENTVETLVFRCTVPVSLGYSPYFSIVDNREFKYIESQDMACALANFIGRLEGSRLKAYLIEIAIPSGYLSDPSPFLKCSVGGISFVIDGEQIELQDGKMSLIFTGLPA